MLKVVPHHPPASLLTLFRDASIHHIGQDCGSVWVKSKTLVPLMAFNFSYARESGDFVWALELHSAIKEEMAGGLLALFSWMADAVGEGHSVYSPTMSPFRWVVAKEAPIKGEEPLFEIHTPLRLIGSKSTLLNWLSAWILSTSIIPDSSGGMTQQETPAPLSPPSGQQVVVACSVKQERSGGVWVSFNEQKLVRAVNSEIGSMIRSGEHTRSIALTISL